MVRPPVGAARSLIAMLALSLDLEFRKGAPILMAIVESEQGAARRTNKRRSTRHGISTEGRVRKTDSKRMIGYCYFTIVRRNPIKKLHHVIAPKPPKPQRRSTIKHALPCSACIWALLFQSSGRMLVST